MRDENTWEVPAAQHHKAVHTFSLYTITMSELLRELETLR